MNFACRAITHQYMAYQKPFKGNSLLNTEHFIVSIVSARLIEPEISHVKLKENSSSDDGSDKENVT